MNFRHFNAYAYCSKELEVLFLLDARNRLSQTMLNFKIKLIDLCNYLKLLCNCSVLRFALSFMVKAINHQPTILQRTSTKVNYPPTPKAMGLASEVIDSPNGNALLRFCFISDSIPEPDSIFKPCFLMFMLALKSLSCTVLQFLQVHSLSFRVKS